MTPERKAEMIAIREQLKERRRANEKYLAFLEYTLRVQGLPMEIAETVKTVNQNWQTRPDRMTDSIYDSGCGGYSYELQEQMLRYLDTLLTPYSLNSTYYSVDGKPNGIRIAEISE